MQSPMKAKRSAIRYGHYPRITIPRCIGKALTLANFPKKHVSEGCFHSWNLIACVSWMKSHRYPICERRMNLGICLRERGTQQADFKRARRKLASRTELASAVGEMRPTA